MHGSVDSCLDALGVLHASWLLLWGCGGVGQMTASASDGAPLDTREQCQSRS